MIDFYKGADRVSPSGTAAPISIFLDVRPALDSFPAVIDRLYVSAAEAIGVQALPTPKIPNNTSSAHIKKHFSPVLSDSTEKK